MARPHAVTAKSLGIDPELAARAVALAKVPEDEFEREMAAFHERAVADMEATRERLVARGFAIATSE